MCVMEGEGSGRGDSSQRIRLPHPPVDLATAVADSSRESGDRARVGWRKQDRRRLGKKWSRNGKIQTHPLQMVSRCKLRCFRAFPRARPLPPARAPRAHTHSRTHARTHALPGEGRAAASTACNRHTINNNRFLRSGLASRSPASAGGGGGGGSRGTGSSRPGGAPRSDPRPPAGVPSPPHATRRAPQRPPERQRLPLCRSPGRWHPPLPPPDIPEQINK
ncbi:hypothetical protein H8959_020302 [Pygathrix nigripes]